MAPLLLPPKRSGLRFRRDRQKDRKILLFRKRTTPTKLHAVADLLRFPPLTIARGPVGAWRSLVAHLLWEQRVAGSNPAAPTTRTPVYSDGIGDGLYRRHG